jgi:hypothetical protein
VSGQLELERGPLGGSEARRLTDQVKRDAEALWAKLIELYERGAHTALGYSNWHEYAKAEFGFGRSQSYRLLDAGRVVEAIPPVGEREPGGRTTVERTTSGNEGPLLNERQAREFVPLLREEDEEAVVELWTELREEFGERLRAEDVRKAVQKKLRPKEPRTVPARAGVPGGRKSSDEGAATPSSVSEAEFQQAVTDALSALRWRWCHFRPARTEKGWRTALSGAAGFPDLVAARGKRLLVIELKAEGKRPTQEQEAWLEALAQAGADAYCWRPSDWPAIERTLR